MPSKFQVNGGSHSFSSTNLQVNGGRRKNYSSCGAQGKSYSLRLFNQSAEPLASSHASPLVILMLNLVIVVHNLVILMFNLVIILLYLVMRILRCWARLCRGPVVRWCSGAMDRAFYATLCKSMESMQKYTRRSTGRLGQRPLADNIYNAHFQLFVFKPLAVKLIT